MCFFVKYIDNAAKSSESAVVRIPNVLPLRSDTTAF